MEAFLKAFSCAALRCIKFRLFSWILRGCSKPWVKTPEVVLAYSNRKKLLG